MEQAALKTEHLKTDTPSVKILGKADIPAMLALQDKVQSGDLIARDSFSLRRHFNNGDTAIGIEHEGKLLAQLTIKAETAADDTATIGFFMTDPDHRGHGYAGQLLSSATAYIEENGFSTAQARVKQDNGTQAWKHFAKQGFDLVSTGESPEQAGRQVYVLQKQFEDVTAPPKKTVFIAAPMLK